MRAVSLVDHLEFDFNGNILKQGLALGDVDNDGLNELVVGGENGDLFVFKGENKWVSLSGLGFITSVVIGDILNCGKNSLVVITADGWCYIYNIYTEVESQVDEGVDQVDGQIFSSESLESEKSQSSESVMNTPVIDKEKVELRRVHLQRIPANTKDVLLADVDGDGCLELVIGLTDRIVRSYRWINATETSGNLMCMNKWECAKQIGSITLHHSKDEVPALLVAQPGGTFMRIICQAEDICPSLETTGEHSDSGSSRTDSLAGSKIDYQFLGISRTRNQNISTEIVGNLSTKKDERKGNSYTVATLDGTIMLVHDEIILWSIAVDHQIFSLHKMDITNSGSDNIIACSWDGQTYILDQDKNSVRFHFGESVQAFNCGFYNAYDNLNTTCFVYVTFRNKIYLYYDIPLKKMLCQKFEPDLSKLKDVLVDENLDQKSKNELVEFLLYGVKNV
ncbi:hypothetical protein RN001_015300 [Aquatica leii]|uniref:Integrin-alpha FG-GAP repeat-containing protein 2 n=1 Tax=Aquatica leii TaxID=1421715 RepID=A0AAN7S6L3_9COLE|nr:hypothetical protein RN001_015300 [Aquatica leii]